MILGEAKIFDLKSLSTVYWTTCWKLLLTFSGHFYKHILTIIQAWVSNQTNYKVWDEITFPFPNSNGCTDEMWDWISNFIL